MAERGWIHKFAFEDDALSADTDGRSAMQDSYLQNAKVQDGTLTAVKTATSFFLTGVYGIGTYGTSTYG